MWDTPDAPDVFGNTRSLRRCQLATSFPGSIPTRPSETSRKGPWERGWPVGCSSGSSWFITVLMEKWLFCDSLLQKRRTALNCTNLAKEPAEFTQLTLMVQAPLMFSVIKKPLVEVGPWSKKDWTVQLIFSEDGMTTSADLVAWMVSFGSDSIRWIAWQKQKADLEWSLKTQKEILLTLNMISLPWQVRELCTKWALEIVTVSDNDKNNWTSANKRHPKSPYHEQCVRKF